MVSAPFALMLVLQAEAVVAGIVVQAIPQNPVKCRWADTFLEDTDPLEHFGPIVRVCWWQLERGQWFLHERPWSAWSWSLNSRHGLASDPRVGIAKGDQCPFGQWSWDDDPHNHREWRLSPKRTGWLSSRPWLLRAKWAETCPPRKVRAILKELRVHELNCGCCSESMISLLDVGTQVDDTEPIDAIAKFYEAETPVERFWDVIAVYGLPPEISICSLLYGFGNVHPTPIKVRAGPTGSTEHQSVPKTGPGE